MNDCQSFGRAEAILTINLAAIFENWRTLERRVAPFARCAAVVKADAYGLGAAQVASLLVRAGCRRFFVATLDEALSLRAAVDCAEIFVLSGPLPGAEGEFSAANFVPVLNSLKQVADWANEARHWGRRLPCALHIDTGMSRLGITYADAQVLISDIRTVKAIIPKLVMTHLSCADEPTHPMNRSQLCEFSNTRALFPRAQASIAASAGIFLGTAWHADWVRPGAALYGICPQPGINNPMAQVVRLEARIVQVRKVETDTLVGYGATYRTHRRTTLATAAIGYADGLPRALSNRGCGYIDGKRMPLVGRVTMDLSVFDVTDAPEGAAVPGALIELIGVSNTIDDVANVADTIGYEILTSLGKRIHRRYLEHQGIDGGHRIL